jgi:hypothetical protein
VFVKTRAAGESPPAAPGTFFRCPECRQPLGDPVDEVFHCACGLRWGIEDGIYNFKQPIS